MFSGTSLGNRGRCNNEPTEGRMNAILKRLERAMKKDGEAALHGEGHHTNKVFESLCDSEIERLVEKHYKIDRQDSFDQDNRKGNNNNEGLSTMANGEVVFTRDIRAYYDFRIRKPTVWRFYTEVEITGSGRFGNEIESVRARYYPRISTTGQATGWRNTQVSKEEEEGGEGESNYRLYTTGQFEQCLTDLGCINQQNVWIDFSVDHNYNTDVESSHPSGMEIEDKT